MEDKIFLQTKDEWGEELEDKTWCEDRVDESDIVYVKESQLQESQEQVRKLRELIESARWKNKYYLVPKSEADTLLSETEE